jgi:hypothetical protein
MTSRQHRPSEGGCCEISRKARLRDAVKIGRILTNRDHQQGRSWGKLSNKHDKTSEIIMGTYKLYHDRFGDIQRTSNSSTFSQLVMVWISSCLNQYVFERMPSGIPTTIRSAMTAHQALVRVTECKGRTYREKQILCSLYHHLESGWSKVHS